MSGITANSSVAATASIRRNETTVYITSTATPTFIFNTNIVSTETATRFSATPVPDPAASAAIASASAILANSAGNDRLFNTRFIILVSIGGATFLLLLILAIAALIYARRRRRRELNGTETPPFTSLSPAPQLQIPPQSPFPGLTPTPSAPGFFNPPQTPTTRAPPTPPFPFGIAVSTPPPNPPPLARLPPRPRRSISAPDLIPEIQENVSSSPSQYPGKSPTAKRQQEPTAPGVGVRPDTPTSVYSQEKWTPTEASPVSPISPVVGSASMSTRTPTQPRTPRFREGFPTHLRGVEGLDRGRRQQQQVQPLRTNPQEQRPLRSNLQGQARGPESSEQPILSGGEQGISRRPEGNRGAIPQASAVSSEMMFIHRDITRDRTRGPGEEGRGRDTRASSGVFPEP